MGPLCLRRRELLSRPGTFVTEVTLNHEFLMSSLYTDSERALARMAVEMHGGDRLQVLVGGLGLGYTAWQAGVAEPVQSVDVVEFLPEVIDWHARGLLPLSPQLNDLSGLRIQQGDIYARLAAPAKSRHDLILIDVDHSPEERLDHDSVTFYTRAGLEAAARHLAPEGVLAVWSYAEHSPFARALGEAFAEVRIVPISHDNQLVDEQRTDWLFFARSPTRDPAGP